MELAAEGVRIIWDRVEGERVDEIYLPFSRLFKVVSLKKEKRKK